MTSIGRVPNKNGNGTKPEPKHNGNGNGRHRGRYEIEEVIEVPGTEGRAKVYRTRFNPDADPIEPDDTDVMAKASPQALRELVDDLLAIDNDLPSYDDE
jgi:hypothetical protein